jgi:hypothetical protein
MIFDNIKEKKILFCFQRNYEIENFTKLFDKNINEKFIRIEKLKNNGSDEQILKNNIFIVNIKNILSNQHLIKYLDLDFCFIENSQSIFLPEIVFSFGLSKKFILSSNHFINESNSIFDYFYSDLLNNYGYKFDTPNILIPNYLIYFDLNFYFLNEVIENILIFLNNLFFKNEKLITQNKIKPKISIKNKKIEGWLFDVLDEKNSIVVINTDNFNIKEQSQFENIHEVEIIYKILLEFNKNDIENEQIGIITPYVQQKKLFDNYFYQKNFLFNNLFINTLEKFSNIQKDYVIISFVRSSSTLESFWECNKFLFKLFSKAKIKLIMLFSVNSFIQIPLFKNIISNSKFIDLDNFDDSIEILKNFVGDKINKKFNF